jgi:hypothetical protein
MTRRVLAIAFIAALATAVESSQRPATSTRTNAPAVDTARPVTRSAPASADNIIAANRLPSGSTTLPEPSWSTAGARFTGALYDPAGTQGLPVRSVCTTVAVGASANTINSAIQNCPAGQAVMLPAGTYNLSSGITFGNGTKQNVTLRGAGADQTLLNFTGDTACSGQFPVICMKSTDSNCGPANCGGPTNVQNWVGGYVKGAMTIQLANKTNLVVGHVIILDQLNDTTDSGQIFVCNGEGSERCSPANNGGMDRMNRAQAQQVTVTSIEAGRCAPSCDIGIAPALKMDNWSASRSPQAWYSSGPIRGIGVENLSISFNQAGTTTGVEVMNCAGCYFRGVRSVMTGAPASTSNRSHLMAWNSARLTVRDSYFYGQDNGALVTAYGIETHASDSLIENNIFQKVQAPVVGQGGGDGTVVGYNFMINHWVSDHPIFQNQSIFLHAVQNFWLAEGNVGAGIYADLFHGTHHFFTVHRNRWIGTMPNEGTTTTDGTQPIRMLGYSRFFNLTCNVLGTDSRPFNEYQNDDGSHYQAIYHVDSGRTANSLFRWGNYDSFTNSARYLASEVPTGESIYRNAVPGMNACPDSYYRTAKPVWWPSALPWPGIGPNITGGPSNQSGTGADGHAYNNAAANCYYVKMSGPANGVSSPLTFNADACYGAMTPAP